MSPVLDRVEPFSTGNAVQPFSADAVQPFSAESPTAEGNNGDPDPALTAVKAVRSKATQPRTGFLALRPTSVIVDVPEVCTKPRLLCYVEIDASGKITRVIEHSAKKDVLRIAGEYLGGKKKERT